MLIDVAAEIGRNRARATIELRRRLRLLVATTTLRDVEDRLTTVEAEALATILRDHGALLDREIGETCLAPPTRACIAVDRGA